MKKKQLRGNTNNINKTSSIKNNINIANDNCNQNNNVSDHVIRMIWIQTLQHKPKLEIIMHHISSWSHVKFIQSDIIFNANSSNWLEKQNKSISCQLCYQCYFRGMDAFWFCCACYWVAMSVGFVVKNINV